MIAVDTSVVVAGFASWHEGHQAALGVLQRAPRLPAQAFIEAYSVLTRLPPPHRAPATVVAEYLAARFASPPLVLPARLHIALLPELAAAGIAGGAAYDALIGATVRHAGATLVTRDRRALATYERVGVRYQLLT